MKLTKEKGPVKTSSSKVEHVSTRNANDDLSYLLGFTRPQVPQTTYPPPAPLTRSHTYHYAPLP